MGVTKGVQEPAITGNKWIDLVLNAECGYSVQAFSVQLWPARCVIELGGEKPATEA